MSAHEMEDISWHQYQANRWFKIKFNSFCFSTYFYHIVHLCFCGSENVQLMGLGSKMDLHLELPCCWAAELILKCMLFHGSLFKGQISAPTRVHVVVTKHSMLWLVWDSTLLHHSLVLLLDSCLKGLLRRVLIVHTKVWAAGRSLTGITVSYLGL